MSDYPTRGPLRNWFQMRFQSVLPLPWLAFALLGFSSLETRLRAEHQLSSPNIVFLLTDDQATITMGCYGNRDVQTPNLDKLAAAGLVFDNHYVTTSICMASRANIMTGLYEYRTGCNFGRGNMQPKQWKNSYPMLLRSAGYRTAIAGKFGFQVEGMRGLPERDFDKWGGGPGQTHFETAKNPSMKAYAKEYPHSSLSYGAFGRDFIRESVGAKKPFCLSISYKAPHRPVRPDPKFDHIYRDKSFTKPKNFGRQHGAHFAEQSKTGRQYPRFEGWGYASDYDNTMQKYNQLVYAVDQSVGMILKELEEQGVADNTIVIFTSDNGYLCGSHGYGSKVLPYEESARVPLIIFDPRAKTSHHKRTRALTGSIDFAPTMLKLAGLKPPRGIDGTSLLPLLANPSAEVRESLALMNFWGPATTHSLGVVTRKWKYLFWYSEEDGMVAAEELFDMSDERLELKNMAGDDAVLGDLKDMRALYDRHVARIGEQAISRAYRNYSDIFDRKQGWDRKKVLLQR